MALLQQQSRLRHPPGPPLAVLTLHLAKTSHIQIHSLARLRLRPSRERSEPSITSVCPPLTITKFPPKREELVVKDRCEANNEHRYQRGALERERNEKPSTFCTPGDEWLSGKCHCRQVGTGQLWASSPSIHSLRLRPPASCPMSGGQILGWVVGVLTAGSCPSWPHMEFTRKTATYPRCAFISGKSPHLPTVTKLTFFLPRTLFSPVFIFKTKCHGFARTL